MSGLHIGAYGSRKSVVASEIRTAKNGERLVGRNGEINAGSKQELIHRQVQLAELANGIHVVTETAATKAEKDALRIQRRETAIAMMSNPERAREVGSELGDELYLTQQREGFMRNILQRQDVVDGQVPRAVLRKRNTLVSYATGPTETKTQIVRDDWFYPVEFYLTARPYIEQKEITQNSTDVLEDKYMEAMQAFLVQEDRLFIRMCLATIGQSNERSVQVGLMNPVALSNFRNKIQRWGLTPATWLIANDLFTDLAGDAGFQSLYEPMAQHEIVLTGQLGTILGMNIKSDQYRHPEHRVLNKGEQFVFGTPDTLGTYTDRGGIEVLPIDASITGIPGRGWQMTAQQSQTIVNPRAVACGIRNA